MPSPVSDKDLPKLPGYHRSPIAAAARKHNFRYINGYAIERAEPRAAGPAREEVFRRSMELRSAGAGATTPGGSRHGAHSALDCIPHWVTNDRRVLQFTAYFKEAVHESPMESFRVRRCEIFFHCEDGSLRVTEPRQENSGIPQGVFIKRHRVRAPDGERFLSMEDLNVGRDLVLYGRTFHIVDCSGSTREHLEVLGVHVPPAEPLPRDPYTQSRSSAMQRETGADPSVYRGIMTNPMKTFMEARLGKFTRPSGKLASFLANDRKVLRFQCAWDDRGSMFGSLHKYKLHYYLEDDTVEVVNVHEDNSGEDRFGKLLGRSRLPKKPDVALPAAAGAMEEAGPESGDIVSWRDLRVGTTVSVFGRALRLLDCDAFTRAWYSQRHSPQPPAEELREDVPELPRPEIPAYTPGTFGSEADSLASCLSLNPRPPRRDLHKLVENDGKSLRFMARFKHPLRGEEDREFVISFFLADDTVSIFEPQRRNSGRVGGQFLKRSCQKRSDGSSFTEADFFVGACVFLVGFDFVLTDVDDYSLKYMASRATRPFMGVEPLIRDLAERFDLRSSKLQHAFRSIDRDRSSRISMDELRTVLDELTGERSMTEAELLAIMRHFDKDGNGTIDFAEFAHTLMSATHQLERRVATEPAAAPTAAQEEEEYRTVVAAQGERSIRQQQLEQVLHRFAHAFFGKRSMLTQTFRMLDKNFDGLVSK